MTENATYAEGTSVEQQKDSAPRHEKAETKPAGRFASDKPLFRPGAYVEDENWQPSPFDQYGTVQTAGTAGDDVHGDVSEVSPAFHIHRARTLIHGARALDPDDPTSSDLVILPGADHRTEESAREELFAAARRNLDHPVEIGMTEARRKAGEGRNPEEEESGAAEPSSDDDKFEEKPDASGWQKTETTPETV